MQSRALHGMRVLTLYSTLRHVLVCPCANIASRVEPPRDILRVLVNRRWRLLNILSQSGMSIFGMDEDEGLTSEAFPELMQTTCG